MQEVEYTQLIMMQPVYNSNDFPIKEYEALNYFFKAKVEAHGLKVHDIRNNAAGHLILLKPHRHQLSHVSIWIGDFQAETKLMATLMFSGFTFAVRLVARTFNNIQGQLADPRAVCDPATSRTFLEHPHTEEGHHGSRRMLQ